MSNPQSLHWHRLADGDLLCAEYPIRLVKPLRRGDGWTVKVPFDIEPGLDAGDGYWWRELHAPGSTEQLLFMRVAEAKADVAADVAWYLRTEAGFAEDYPLENWPTSGFEGVRATTERKWHEHQAWTASSPAINRHHNLPAPAQGKTPRADLLRLLDQAADLLTPLRASDEQADALLDAIGQIRR